MYSHKAAVNDESSEPPKGLSATAAQLSRPTCTIESSESNLPFTYSVADVDDPMTVDKTRDAAREQFKSGV